MNLEFNIFGKKIDFKNLIKISAKIGLILLIFISIYLLNHSVLLSPDDYNYTFVQGSNLTQRVDSLENALQTGRFFYQNWTGRVVPHVLIGIFRNINPYIYEIVNSLVFMIFILMISKVLNKKTSFLSILFTFGYLAFSKMFGEKFAWISGSFNYLWPSTLLVIFIYYFYNYFIEQKNLNILGKIALILFSFIVGFMHENTAFVGGAFLVCLIGFKIKDFIKFDNKKKIVTILIFIMFCLGAFANIFAPGNFTRMDQVSGGFSWSFLENYKLNIVPIIFVILSMILVFILHNLELIKIEKSKIFKKENLKKLDIKIIKTEILYFILPALIATVPMAVISYFPPRAFLAYELMFMIVLAKNVTIISERFEEKDIYIAIASIIFTLVIFGRYSPSTLAQINYIIPYKNQITAEYEEASQKGEKDVVVTAFEYLPWIHAEDYINIHNFFPEFNYKMPTNALISMYYGFDRVTAIKENEYLVEIEVDTDGINPYEVIEKDTEKNIYTMEYDNQIRFQVPKDKLGIYLLDCRENGLVDKILDYKVRSTDQDVTEQVSIEQLIIK